MIDRVLELRAQIDSAMEKFDAAIVERNGAMAATIHADRARYLDEQFADTVPSTLDGAVCKLQDVIVTMEAGGDPLAPKFTRQLNPIIGRLSKGNLQLSDIIRLRGIYSSAVLHLDADDSALAGLDTTITGLCRPNVVASKVLT